LLCGTPFDHADNIFQFSQSRADSLALSFPIPLVTLSQKFFGERKKLTLRGKVGSISVRVSFGMICRLLNGSCGLHSRIEFGQEILSFRGFPKLDVYLFRRWFPIKQLAILLTTSVKGGKNPLQDRSTRG
jgi:hypothetical protein